MVCSAEADSPKRGMTRGDHARLLGMRNPLHRLLVDLHDANMQRIQVRVGRHKGACHYAITVETHTVSHCIEYRLQAVVDHTGGVGESAENSTTNCSKYVILLMTEPQHSRDIHYALSVRTGI